MNKFVKEGTIALAAVATVAALPSVAFAQNTDFLDDGIDIIITFLSSIPALLIAVAVIIVLWGILKFIMAGDDEGARATGKKTIMWGVVGIVLMTSLMAIVVIVQQMIGIDDADTGTLETDPLDFLN